MEQHSKKDLVCEQVEIVYMPACVQPIVLMQKIDFSLPCKITSLIFTQETLWNNFMLLNAKIIEKSSSKSNIFLTFCLLVKTFLLEQAVKCYLLVITFTLLLINKPSGANDSIPQLCT